MIGRTRILTLLFCGSLAVKLAGVAYMNANPALNWNLVAPDTRGSYLPLAQSMLQGRGYRIGTGERSKVEGTAPGFPMYLVVVFRVFGTGVPTWALGVLNALMRATTTLLVYGLAFRAFGDRAALAAGVIHSLDPWEAFWTAFVLKESLAVMLSILALGLTVQMLERPTWWRAACAGVVLAAAGLTRYASLGLWPVVFLLVAIATVKYGLRGPSAIKAAIAFTLAFAAGMSLWIVPNYAHLGGPIAYMRPGLNLFVSNGPGAEQAPDTWGYSGLSIGSVKAAHDIEQRQDSPTKRELALFRATVVHLVTHPQAAARLAGARFVNMWRPTFVHSSAANVLVLGVTYSLMNARTRRARAYAAAADRGRHSGDSR